MATPAPLEGIKILDFSWVIVGPLTTKYFADHGATVVRIESHVRPDEIRAVSPIKDGIADIEHGGMFPNLNSSKYSISLNLRKHEGQAIAWKLIRWADVVTETFSPGQMAQWGLDYESVRQVRPDIVYFSSSPRGETGRYAKTMGYGPLITALSGVYHLSGWPERRPSPPYGAYSDYVAPHFAVAAILAALEYSQRTGKGQLIDLSQLEALVAMNAVPVMEYAVNGHVMNRSGNRLPYASPHGAFRCRGNERWCGIAVFDETEWKQLCKAMGSPDWTREAKFSTLLSRKENEDELERFIESWTVTYSPEEVEAKLQSAGVTCSVIESSKDLFEDPQLAHVGFFRWLEHKAWGSYAYSGPCFRLSKTPDQLRRSPYLGEHNEYVLKEILGMSNDEIAENIINGAITTEADLPPMGGSV
jgi:benzylsuccinate CoA-transferase BbsF subunit